MRYIILFLWRKWDPIYYSFSRLRNLEDGKTNMLRIRLTKYRGRRVILSDGTIINKNDLLIKIHLHNIQLLQQLNEMNSELKRAKFVYRSVQNSLPALEQFIRNHPYHEKIKGIIGITSIYKASDRLGFERIPIKNPFYKWFKAASFFTINFLSLQNASIIKIFKEQTPQYLMMSKRQLMERYHQQL